MNGGGQGGLRWLICSYVRLILRWGKRWKVPKSYPLRSCLAKSPATSSIPSRLSPTAKRWKAATKSPSPTARNPFQPPRQRNPRQRLDSLTAKSHTARIPSPKKFFSWPSNSTSISKRPNQPPTTTYNTKKKNDTKKAINIKKKRIFAKIFGKSHAKNNEKAFGKLCSLKFAKF